jgi:hypothetical protein
MSRVMVLTLLRMFTSVIVVMIVRVVVFWLLLLCVMLMLVLRRYFFWCGFFCSTVQLHRPAVTRFLRLTGIATVLSLSIGLRRIEWCIVTDVHFTLE